MENLGVLRVALVNLNSSRLSPDLFRVLSTMNTPSGGNVMTLLSRSAATSMTYPANASMLTEDDHNINDQLEVHAFTTGPDTRVRLVSQKAMHSAR